MKKIVFKKKGVYGGVESYSDTVYTDEFLDNLKEEIFNFETLLISKYVNKKTDMYNSEYSYELGMFLQKKLDEVAIIESDRYKFWEMLREYVNEKDVRRVITDKRDPYEYCYMLSKLEKNLALKYSRSRWDHLFDCVTAREDDRIFEWLKENNNENFNKDSAVWKEFIKGIKVRFKKIDTKIYSKDMLFNIYNDIMYKSILLVEFLAKYGKLNSQSRDLFFKRTTKISYCEPELLKRELLLIYKQKT